eukprot:13283888-Alexandrium_andersonii.AAC.1
MFWGRAARQSSEYRSREPIGHGGAAAALIQIELYCLSQHAHVLMSCCRGAAHRKLKRLQTSWVGTTAQSPHHLA